MPLQISKQCVGEVAALFLGSEQQVTVLSQLVSYDDLNLQIQGPPSRATQQSDECGTALDDETIVCTYVLKVYSAAASKNLQLVQAQHASMECMQKHCIPSNVPVPSLEGASVLTTALTGSAEQHAVQLLTWVAGDIMGKGPQSPTLQRSLGSFLGCLTVALSDFSHPGVPTAGPWCMNSAAATIQRRASQLEGISREQRCQLLAAAAQLEERSSEPLPQQVCHADANEANILVDAARTQVIGIIDWGDICYCWRAAEVAVAMTYMMLLQPGNPVAAARHVLEGYLQVVHLEPCELQLLPSLIQARVALSLTNGLYSVRDNPGNAQYLLDTQAGGWDLLAKLQQLQPGGLLHQQLLL